MSKVFKIEIDDKVKITGRLVGFIDDKECTALINSDDAPQKVFTSESTSIKDSIGHMSDKRFVIAVRNINEDNTPSLFISPKIMSILWRGGTPELHCENKKAYKFVETK